MAPFFDPKGKGKARAFPLEGLSIQEPAFVKSIEPRPSSSKVLLRATPPALVYTPSDTSSTAAMKKASESAMPPPRVPFIVVPLSHPPSPLQEVIDFSHVDDPDVEFQSLGAIFSQSLPTEACPSKLPSFTPTAAYPAAGSLVWMPPVVFTSGELHPSLVLRPNYLTVHTQTTSPAKANDDFIDAVLDSESNLVAMPHDEFEAMAQLLEDALENVGDNTQNSTNQTDEGEQVRTEPLQASAETLMGRKIAGLPKKCFSKPRSPANTDVTPPVTVASNVTIDDTMGADGQSDSFPSPLHQASKPLEGGEAIPAYLKDGRKIRGLPRRGVQHATPCLPTKPDPAHLSPPLAPAPAPLLPPTSVAAVAEILTTAPILHRPIVKKPTPTASTATHPIPPPIIAASIDMLQAPQPSLGMDIEAAATPLQPSFLPRSSFAQPAFTDTFEMSNDAHPTVASPLPPNPPQDVYTAPTTEAAIFDATMAHPTVETVANATHPDIPYHAMDVKVDSSGSMCSPALPGVPMTHPMADDLDSMLPREAPESWDVNMGNNDSEMDPMPLYAYRSQLPALPPVIPPAAFVVEVDDNDNENEELPGRCTPEFNLAMIKLSMAMEVMRISSLDEPEEAIHYVHVPMESAGPTEDEVIEILLHPEDSDLSVQTSPENAPIAAVVVPQNPVNPEENHSPSVTPPATPSDSAAASLSAQEEDPVKAPNPSETASSQESGSINVPDVASTPASPGSTTKSSEPATPPETPLETCSFLAELAFMRQLGTIASTGLLLDRHVRGTFKELKEHFLRLGHPHRSAPGLNSIRTASGMTRDLLRKNGLRYDPNASKWHGPKGELGNSNVQSSSSTTSSSPGLTTGSESGSDSSFDAPWVHSVEQSPLQPSAKTWKRNYNSLGLQV